MEKLEMSMEIKNPAPETYHVPKTNATLCCHQVKERRNMNTDI